MDFIRLECFASYTLRPILKNFIFCTSLQGGWGRKLLFKFLKDFVFNINEKSRRFKTVRLHVLKIRKISEKCESNG